MAKQTRLSPRLWEQHRERILKLYQDHPLNHVMHVMHKEHNFKATKMAFKKKLGRWRALSKNRKHTDKPSVGESYCPDNGPGEVLSVSPSGNQSSVESESETDEPQSSMLPHRQTISKISFSSDAEADASESSSLTSFVANNLDDTSHHMSLQRQSPKDSGGQEQNAACFIRLILSKLFRVNQVPSDQDTECMLNLLFGQYAGISDVPTLERLLAAYFFLLGPSNHSYLMRCKQYCALAISVQGPRKASAVHFQRAISSLAQGDISLTCKVSLQSDISVAMRLWEEGYLENSALLSIVAKLENLYRWEQPQICQTYGVKLAVLEAWLTLCDRADTSLTDGTENSVMSQWMIDILNALRELLSSLSPFYGFGVASEEIQFVHRCMECLQLWQQHPKRTDLLSEALRSSIEALHEKFSQPTVMGLAWDAQLHFAAVCFSAMQRPKDCKRYDVVEEWRERLNPQTWPLRSRSYAGALDSMHQAQSFSSSQRTPILDGTAFSSDVTFLS